MTNLVNGLASNTEMDDNSNCDATVVLLKKGNCSSKLHCFLAEVILSGPETEDQSGHQFHFVHPWILHTRFKI